MQSWPCLWKSPHPSDICCKVDPNGKVWGNPQITHAASDTKMSSYSSSLCKRCRKMMMATPLPPSNQTWLQSYERNVKSSPVNSLDISIRINQNTWKRSLNVSAAFTLACVSPMGKNPCSRCWQQHRNNLSLKWERPRLSIRDSKNRRCSPAMKGQQHQDCHRHLCNNKVRKQRNDNSWELICVWCELRSLVFTMTWFLWRQGSQAYNKLVSSLARHPQSREDDEWRGTDGLAGMDNWQIILQK